MTAQEVLAEVVRRGIHVRLDGDLLRAAGPLDDTLRAGLRANRDQLVAVFKLREVHRAMGFSEEDVMFIEAGLLSGRINEIRICAKPASQEAA